MTNEMFCDGLRCMIDFDEKPVKMLNRFELAFQNIPSCRNVCSMLNPCDLQGCLFVTALVPKPTDKLTGLPPVSTVAPTMLSKSGLYGAGTTLREVPDLAAGAGAKAEAEAVKRERIAAVFMVVTCKRC